VVGRRTKKDQVEKIDREATIPFTTTEVAGRKVS